MQATWSRTIYQSTADFSALASSASEGTLLGGANHQPVLAPWALENPVQAASRRWHVYAAGVFSNTGTPTMIFQLRLSTTAGSATLGGTSVGQTAAITTTSGVTNVGWELDFDITCRTPAIGTGNCTLVCHGFVRSPAGFASPFGYLLVPSSGSPGTWTQTIDGGLTQYLNASLTWGASSASNTCTLKDLSVVEFN